MTGYLWLGLIAFAYLAGAVPFALIVGRLLRGIDIRQHGSGNVGATNVLRTMGWGPSLLVFALDFAKGALPTWLAWQLGGSLPLATLSALAAVVGHNWSPYIRFTGGKGVTTSLGALYVLSLPTAVVATVVGCGVIGLSRYVSLGSVSAAAVSPLFALALYLAGGPAETLVYVLIASALLIAQHRSNIRRLLAGKESRVGDKVGSLR